MQVHQPLRAASPAIRPRRNLHTVYSTSSPRYQTNLFFSFPSLPVLSPLLKKRAGIPTLQWVLRSSSRSRSTMGGDSFTAGESGSPLAAVAEAFEELARSFQDCSTDLRLAPFSDACALIPVLFGCIGFAFKFAEMEYVSKVNNLLEASKTYDTLSNILDDDVKHDTARKPESHSQNLCRVRLGLDLIRALFEQFLTANWATRKAIGAGMYTLPTWEQLLSRLNETDAEAPHPLTSKFSFSEFAIIPITLSRRK